MRPAEKSFYAALGARVRRAREGTNRSQALLAELVGVPRTSLILMERGDQRIGVYVLSRMAAVLEIPVAELLADEEHGDAPVPDAARVPGMPADASAAVRAFVSNVRQAAVTQKRRV